VCTTPPVFNRSGGRRAVRFPIIQCQVYSPILQIAV